MAVGTASKILPEQSANLTKLLMKVAYAGVGTLTTHARTRAGGGAVVTYWWASQDQTRSAIDDGTLWTCLTKDGVGIPGSTRINELEVGDLVFKYAGGSV